MSSDGSCQSGEAKQANVYGLKKKRGAIRGGGNGRGEEEQKENEVKEEDEK